MYPKMWIKKSFISYTPTMYLDRNDISFRKEDEKDLLTKEQLTIFRPDNRIYPKERWYMTGEVVKARVIDVPWNDSEKKAPIFSKTIQLVKIQAIEVLNKENIENSDFENSLEHIKSKNDLDIYFKNIYKNVPNEITKIKIKKIAKENLIDNSQEIKNLFETWMIKIAKLPENNIQSIEELLAAENFSLTFINHDYAGITPKMRNHIAEHYNINIKNAMVIIQPENFEHIIEILKKNKKYIWWWLGVWFKDFGRNTIKEKTYGFIHPVADEMQSINFIAHFWEEIHGYNSDASWYVDSLCDKFKEIGTDIQNKTIILLWAWWTARWIALELVNRGIKNIFILNRTKEKAEHIAKNLNQIKKDVATAWTEEMIYDIQNQKIDAIINLSTKWADGDFEKYSGLVSTEGWIEKNIQETENIIATIQRQNQKIIISDINLTKNKTTPLLEIAKQNNLPTLDGQLMVVYQWVQAIWTIFGDKIIEAWGTKEEVQNELLKLIYKIKK